MNYGQSPGGSGMQVDDCQLAFEEWLTGDEGIKYASHAKVSHPRRGPMILIAGLRRAFEAGMEWGRNHK